jgi:membrane protein
MQFQTKDVGLLLKTTFTEWNDKDPFRQSAVIAYYAVFSIPGLLF